MLKFYLDILISEVIHGTPHISLVMLFSDQVCFHVFLYVFFIISIHIIE